MIGEIRILRDKFGDHLQVRRAVPVTVNGQSNNLGGMALLDWENIPVVVHISALVIDEDSEDK